MISKQSLKYSPMNGFPENVQKTSIPDLFEAKGYFHQWISKGEVSQPYAIVELSNGKIVLVEYDQIEFTSPGLG